MSNTNKAKAEQLGMPFGTASHRLKKMLMFKFAQELGYDKCFSCGEPIETVEELSVEHKKPWFNRNPELFWDLDNIAFSHLKCNRPNNPRNGHSHKYDNRPVGMTWCGIHKKYLPVEVFSKRSNTKSGYRENCKDCEADSQRQRRHNGR